MQLIAKAVLWLHSTLYRLTNGRIGGKFIAGSPILLLTTTGRRTGKQRTRPLAYVRDGDRFVLCASNGGSLTIPPGITTCAPPAEPSSRSAPSSLPSAPRLPIPPSAPSCSPALCRCTRATPATSTRPAARSRSWC
jgi:hypothetical protein